jgi:hypothetical protein
MYCNAPPRKAREGCDEGLRAEGKLTNSTTMLIFHEFPDAKQADDFALHVRDTFGRTTIVCESQEMSNKYDTFPFELKPPIVLVQRDELDKGPQLEPQIEKLVEEFNGRFAGT